MYKLGKFLLSVFSVIISLIVLYTTASDANISSVGYVHNAIYEIKGIYIPIPNMINTNSINSVKYLLHLIDDANEIINGFRSTNYANSESAKPQPSTTAFVDKKITELVVNQYVFSVTVSNVNTFDFQMSARGDFSIDWDDGYVDTINKTDTSNITYSHNYTTTGNYTIKISGTATEYNTNPTTATISFGNSANKTKITEISGGLGRIFSTLPDGTNPRFYKTFYGCTGIISSIPNGLFAGIHGAPVTRMFSETFRGCSGLTGSIPLGLFGDISGNATDYMFHYTFQGCSNLTGSIPPGLFGDISGNPAIGMFNSTFSGCSGLTGSIPSDLFGNINGSPARYMFESTFGGCSGLTGEIPPSLFGNIYGAPASHMYWGTFSGCNGLTGEIPSSLFGNIYGAPASHMYSNTFYNCSGLTGSIPTGLFGVFHGTPATDMFARTFANCSGLVGIDNGIWDISDLDNDNVTNMFYQTFTGCYNINSASPTISHDSSTKLWEHFTSYAGEQTFINAVNLADYADIPAGWK